CTLRARGVHLIEPDSGRLASKDEEGVGRLPDPAQLLEICGALLAETGMLPGGERLSASVGAGSGLGGGPSGVGPAGTGAWRGLRVLVTAGGTREPIDSVRFVGNSSSGRMGLALAQAARARGAEVTVVAANVSLPRPAGVAWRAVATAAQLQEACEQEFPGCDVLLMAAAVADFRPAEAQDGKIKKSTRERLHLELEPTTDVLRELALSRTGGQTLVGFAAEHGERALQHAREKLQAKRLDAVVVNDISRPDIGFEVDSNEVTIVAAASEEHVPRASKEEVAEAILDAVERLRAGV
ncbi:MAG: phosphopantothenoylcysteine decarboxylase, partial [Solirubrobacteraceae bacterium]